MFPFEWEAPDPKEDPGRGERRAPLERRDRIPGSPGDEQDDRRLELKDQDGDKAGFWVHARR